MNRTISWCLVIVSAAVVVVLSFTQPGFLSDRNAFMQGFITHELLSFLGVIVTVTLASAGHLHLSLNQLQESLDAHGIVGGFARARREIKHQCMALIWLLVLAVALVVAKPPAVTAGLPEWGEALLNGAGLLLILASVLTLVDVTSTTFALKAPSEMAADHRKRR